MPKTKIPTGYICGKCTYPNRFPVYVYAHWRDVLRATCEKCGAKYSVVCGIATRSGPSRKIAKIFYDQANP